MRYDIAIIGTGPAGYEAAITAKVRNKNIILFGNDAISQKVAKAHTIKNYLGLKNVSGEEMNKAFQDHLKDLDIEITKEKINAVYAMGDFFSIQSMNNNMYEATAVIIATGVMPGKLLPGEEELLGQGVSYCATCDASLYKGKNVAVIGYSSKEEDEARFLSEVCNKVYYYPMYEDKTDLPNSIEVIKQKPIKLASKLRIKTVVTDEGELDVDGIFVLRDAVSPGQLVPGLETNGSHIVVDRALKTSIPGCFACGDITGAPYQYIKAAGEGNVAALSAVGYLDKLKRTQN